MYRCRIEAAAVVPCALSVTAKPTTATIADAHRYATGGFRWPRLVD
jgi:hypothetical protein